MMWRAGLHLFHQSTCVRYIFVSLINYICFIDSVIDLHIATMVSASIVSVLMAVHFILATCILFTSRFLPLSVGAIAQPGINSSCGYS